MNEMPLGLRCIFEKPNHHYYYFLLTGENNIYRGSALARAGPAPILISYTIVGFIVYLVMCALGEMAAWLPLGSGFTGYATRFCDPALGFSLGWTYWFKYVKWNSFFFIYLCTDFLIPEQVHFRDTQSVDSRITSNPSVGASGKGQPGGFHRCIPNNNHLYQLLWHQVLWRI